MGDRLGLILTLRSWFFEYLRQTLYNYALEHLEVTRLETKLGFVFSSYIKCLTIINHFEGQWLIGTHFRR